MRALGVDDLRAIVTDPAELAKGATYQDQGGLTGLARHGDRLYGDAAGGTTSLYKVSVTITDKVAARCTCMAARTRPFCKHAAALLVAWSRTPEGFVRGEGPPPGAAPERGARRTKKGKTDAAALMADGVARVISLVRELAITGVSSVAEGRAESLRGLAELLRAGRLRRLAGRVRELAGLIAPLESGGAVAADDHAELLAELLLTARKIEKHLAGEPLDPRHVEELIGKTWRKDDRAPVTGLELVEYADTTEWTADEFQVRAGRFVDVATGAHHAEKQIIPGFLARRTPPRISRAGLVLRGATGSLYPGYPPRRLDLGDPGEVRALDQGALERLLATALPGVSAALAAFQDHRKDVFAPELLPVTVRTTAIVAGGPGVRLRIVDDAGTALHLPDDRLLEDQLAGALRGARLRAVIGDLGLDLTLPVLAPTALVLDRLGQLTLRTVTTAKHQRPGARRVIRAAAAARPIDWASQARAAGASIAGVSLAEVRSEIAELLAQGVGSFTERAVAPLVARLAELGLERPGQILAGVPARPAGERLEDIVRVHQVLGVALVRLVSATTIDTAALMPVPTLDSVLIPRPPRWLDLDETARARAAHELDHWTAEAHIAQAFAQITPGELLRDLGWWSDEALAPAVVAQVAAEPGVIALARGVLAAHSTWGRAARRTAIRILVAADLAGAPRHVAEILGRDGDRALGSFALEQIDAARERAGDPAGIAHRRERRAIAIELTRTLVHASSPADRVHAAEALGDLPDDVAGAALRRALYADESKDVQAAVALALGRRCDLEGLALLAGELRLRSRLAPAAARALGESGDRRAAALLVESLDWKPAIVGDALRAAGAAAIPALRAAVARHPTLGKKKVVRELLANSGTVGPAASGS